MAADTTGLAYQSTEWFRACAEIEEGRRAGREVVYRYRDRTENAAWAEISSPSWGEAFDYRLRPEPRELWAVHKRDGGVAVFDNRQGAEVFAAIEKGRRVALYREVLE